MAFYHTYRPQKFTDLELTQGKVAEILARTLVKKNIGHAYLFTGTHGTGKTSTARILAKAINCIQYDTVKASKLSGDMHTLLDGLPVPCNSCDSCLTVTNGNSLDVIEMDAASNRGIDEIRDLKEKVRLAPVLGKKKVYIIDEVHMLTTEAFNALLKTLEEPPTHVLFVLCTTELHKVPTTIQSRCTHIAFTKPGKKELLAYLRYIAQQEKLSADEAALDAIARAAGGAFRDAAKLLEQASIKSSTINMDTIAVLTVLDVGRATTFEDIFSLLYSKNLMQSITYIDTLQSQGADFLFIIKELLGYSRQLLLVQVGVSQDMPQNILEFAQKLTAPTLVEFIELLMKALTQQKSSPLPALPLELVFYKICASSPAIVSQQVATQSVVKKVKEVPVEQPPIITLKKEEKPVEVEPQIEIVEQIEVTPVEVIENPTLEIMQSRWSEVVKLVRKYNASMASLLSKSKVVGFENKSLTIEVQTAFQKDMLENPKKRDIVEQAVFELTGLQVRIKCALGIIKNTQKNVENFTPVADEDLVSAAMEIFNG